MVDNQMVSMTENGVLISSDSGQFSIPWSELKAGHFLIKDGQSGVLITMLAGCWYFPNIQCLGWVEGPINTGL